MIVLLLAAAFLAPLVIDWTAFRDSFEKRASAIIGQPVRIYGDIDVSLLPATSVTFGDVEIGDTEGDPMARIERLSLRIELLPMLGGQYNVSELTLDRPRVEATIDDNGTLDWLLRPEGAGSLDPAKVALGNVVIRGGVIDYFDARTGGAFTLSQINTNALEAGALTGPWRVEGSLVCRADRLCGEALPVTFSFASGRLAADGSMVLSAEITPASADLAGTLRADGTISNAGDELAYGGSFSFAKLSLEAGAPGQGLGEAWTVAGDFDLTAEQLSIDGVRWESADGIFALAGSAELALGDHSSFEAEIVSRQIDLGRALGHETGAIDAAAAGAELWATMAGLTPPDLPGRISVSIPSVIVSDSILRDIEAEIVADDAGWEIETLQLGLPGQSQLDVGGRFVPGDAPRFDGEIALSSEQPPVLAGWWFGRDYGALALQPFVLEALVHFAPGEVLADDTTLTIGDEMLAGGFGWSGADGGESAAHFDLTTAAFDFRQIVAMIDLMGIDAVGELTTDYRFRLAADTLRYGEVAATDVLLDGALTNDALAINAFTVGDLGGVGIAVDGNWGGFANGVPRGTLNARIAGDDLAGIEALAAVIDPDGLVSEWLAEAAPFLAPVDLEAVVQATVAAGFTYGVTIAGEAGGTDIRVELDANGGPENWSSEEAQLTVAIDAEGSIRLVRQAGLAVNDMEASGPASFDLTAIGVPEDGMTVTLQAAFAGASIAADGALAWEVGEAAQFNGTVDLTADLDPLLRLAGIALPNAGDPIPAVLSADIRYADDAFAIDLAPSSLAERAVEGALTLTAIEGTPRLTGALAVEEVDLGWLVTMPFGATPLPSEDAEAPWSGEPFAGRMAEGIDLDLDMTAERLSVADELTVSNADLSLALSGDSAAVALRSGSLSTGIVSGNVQVAFEGGQALVGGQLFLADVPVDALVWRSAGQPVAEGILNLSADFEALGRSPAALAANLSGSGSIGISQGVFHFLGADAFDLVIRLADEGETMSEEDLRTAFTDFLDAGTLSFGDANVPFDIVAGIITPSQVIKEVDDIRLTIRAPIDLARMTLDSSWELALVDARSLDNGPQPRAFVTFAGPISAPVRQVNVAPLAGYLSLRRLRETDQLQAEVLERERLIRIIERIEADQAMGFAPELAPAEPGVAEPAGP